MNTTLTVVMFLGVVIGAIVGRTFTMHRWRLRVRRNQLSEAISTLQHALDYLNADAKQLSGFENETFAANDAAWEIVYRAWRSVLNEFHALEGKRAPELS